MEVSHSVVLQAKRKAKKSKAGAVDRNVRTERLCRYCIAMIYSEEHYRSQEMSRQRVTFGPYRTLCTPWYQQRVEPLNRQGNSRNPAMFWRKCKGACSSFTLRSNDWSDLHLHDSITFIIRRNMENGSGENDRMGRTLQYFELFRTLGDEFSFFDNRLPYWRGLVELSQYCTHIYLLSSCLGWYEFCSEGDRRHVQWCLDDLQKSCLQFV